MGRFLTNFPTTPTTQCSSGLKVFLHSDPTLSGSIMSHTDGSFSPAFLNLSSGEILIVLGVALKFSKLTASSGVKTFLGISPTSPSGASSQSSLSLALSISCSEGTTFRAGRYDIIQSWITSNIGWSFFASSTLPFSKRTPIPTSLCSVTSSSDSCSVSMPESSSDSSLRSDSGSCFLTEAGVECVLELVSFLLGVGTEVFRSLIEKGVLRLVSIPAKDAFPNNLLNRRISSFGSAQDSSSESCGVIGRNPEEELGLFFEGASALPLLSSTPLPLLSPFPGKTELSLPFGFRLEGSGIFFSSSSTLPLFSPLPGKTETSLPFGFRLVGSGFGFTFAGSAFEFPVPFPGTISVTTEPLSLNVLTPTFTDVIIGLGG